MLITKIRSYGSIVCHHEQGLYRDNGYIFFGFMIHITIYFVPNAIEIFSSKTVFRSWDTIRGYLMIPMALALLSFPV